MNFGRKHPVLEELLILGIIMRCSNSTIMRTVLSGLKLQPLIWARAAKLAWIPQKVCSPPQRCRPSGLGAGQWSQVRVCCLFHLEISPSPSPGLLLVLLFSFILRHCCSSNCHWHELSPVHRGLFPLWPTFPFHSNFIWAKQLKGWCSNHVVVSFSTGGQEICSLIAGKSMKFSQGGLLASPQKWCYYKLLTAWSVNKSWTVQQLNDYQSICTIHQMYKYAYIICKTFHFWSNFLDINICYFHWIVGRWWAS